MKFNILSLFISLLPIIIYDLYNNNKYINTNKKITKEYYKKIYKLIYDKSELSKDPYKRKLNKSVVKKFCKIALGMGIKEHTFVTEEQFDLIYKTYVEYQIDLYKNV